MENPYTLEKLEISKKISMLEVSVSTLSENIRLNHESTKNLLEKHETTIFGNGNGKVGLNTRLDRLEQIEDTRKWHLRSIWLALIGFLAKILHLSLR